MNTQMGVIGYNTHHDTYGLPLSSTTPPAMTHGYTGEQTDPNGLLYLRARYYDPQMGTFLSPDPYAGNLSNLNSRNGYNYAAGNPVNYRDPSGMACENSDTIGHCWGSFFQWLGNALSSPDQ